MFRQLGANAGTDTWLFLSEPHLLVVSAVRRKVHRNGTLGCPPRLPGPRHWRRPLWMLSILFVAGSRPVTLLESRHIVIRRGRRRRAIRRCVGI